MLDEGGRMEAAYAPQVEGTAHENDENVIFFLNENVIFFLKQRNGGHTTDRKSEETKQ